MTKYLRLPLRLEVTRYSDMIALTIKFEAKALVDWCLALCLLDEGLIERLVVSGETGREKLEIRVMRAEEGVRSHASFESETTRVRMAQNDLGYLVCFFLEYYRDGGAKVDHVDVQAVTEPGGREDAYITFQVPVMPPPLIPEKMKRRLGIQ